MVAFDDGDRDGAAQVLYGSHQQRCLARSGAGHQVEAENPPFKKEGAIARGEPVIVGQDILFHAHQPLRSAAARSLHGGAFVNVVMAMRMVMPLPVMNMIITMVIVPTLWSALISPGACESRPVVESIAPADGTHQATSRSLMRISSPWRIWSW